MELPVVLCQRKVLSVLFLLNICTSTSHAQVTTHNHARATALCITTGVAWPSRKPDWISGPVGLIGLAVDFPRSARISIPVQVQFVPWSFLQHTPGSNPPINTGCLIYPCTRHTEQMESGYSIEFKGGAAYEFKFPAGQKARLGITIGARGQLEKWRTDTYLNFLPIYNIPEPDLISYDKRSEFRSMLELNLLFLPDPDTPNLTIGITYALSAYIFGDVLPHPISLDGFRLMVNLPMAIVSKHHASRP